MNTAANTYQDWHFALVGWPILIVIPIAIIAWFLIRKLAHKELEPQPAKAKRGILALRGLVVLLMVIILSEPTLSRRRMHTELPKVTVLIDSSGSMAVNDKTMAASRRLNEAIALGHIPKEVRDTSFAKASSITRAISAAIPAWNKALTSPGAGTAEKEKHKNAVVAAKAEMLKINDELNSILPFLAGHNEIRKQVDFIHKLIKKTITRLEGKRNNKQAKALQVQFRKFMEQSKRLNAKCEQAQLAADAALVSAAGKGSVIKKGVAKVEGLSRYKRAFMLVQKKIAPMLKDKVIARYVAMGQDMTPVSIDKYEKIALEGQTDFEKPLAELSRSSGDSNLGAIILISDGRQTSGADPGPTIRALRERGTKFGAIMVGDPSQPRDAAVAEIVGSQEIFRGETLRLDVKFRIIGYKNKKWNLILSNDGKELERRVVTGNGSWQIERFEFPAKDPGLMYLQARIERVDSSKKAKNEKEATLDNNQTSFVVSVNEDPLKVLLIDAYPRWDSRYLMNMLERDRRVKLVRRFRSIRLPRGEHELIPKTQKEMDSYDGVILGDFKPEEISPEEQKILANFVVRRGGFMVQLAGPRGLPGGYSLGGLADILPVKVIHEEQGKSVPSRLQLARQGERHPVMAVLKDPALNIKLWPALPPLTWICRNVTIKPGAQVLLETTDAAHTPVVVLGRYGAGRVIYIGSDESWRWRDRLDDRIHQTFWLQALRWGLGLRMRGKNAMLQMSLSQSMIEPNESIVVRARAAKKDGTPLDAKLRVKIEKLDAKGKPIASGVRDMELAASLDNPDIQLADVENLQEGRWRLSVTSEAPELKGLVEMRELMVRRQPGREGVELGADLATLQRLSELGGHRAGDFSEVDSVVGSLIKTLKPRKLRKVDTFSLWDSYLVLLVIVGLLLIEWIWRKRIGLP